MDIDLKLLTLEYIKQQDNLPIEDKVSLGKFVMESSDNQVLTLLSTGKMVNEAYMGNLGGPGGLTITQALNSLNVTLGPKAIEVGQYAVGGAAVIGALMMFGAIVKLASSFYDDVIHKYKRKCSDYHGGKARELCIAEVTSKGLKLQIQKLQGAKKYCSKSKDPKRCGVKVNEKIQTIKFKYAKNEIKRKKLGVEIKKNKNF